MTKYGKWLGGTLGWAFGGPVGALLGFAIGAVIDTAEFEVQTMNGGAQNMRRPPSTSGDFSVSLLVLSAAVMKADGRPMKSELEYIRNFFVTQFGESKATQDMLVLKDLLKKEIPLLQVCTQIRQFMPLPQRLQLLHYLFGIAKADGFVDKREVEVIYTISSYLGIADPEFNSLKAMYFRDVNSDYKILESEASASNDEIKKAYRKMALKYHPDKVSQLGEELQKGAKEKFLKVQQAYDNIRKQRGF